MCIQARKLKIEGTFSALILHIFPWTQSNLNLKIKRRLNFNEVLQLMIFQV